MSHALTTILTSFYDDNVCRYISRERNRGQSVSRPLHIRHLPAIEFLQYGLPQSVLRVILHRLTVERRVVFIQI